MRTKSSLLGVGLILSLSAASSAFAQDSDSVRGYRLDPESLHQLLEGSSACIGGGPSTEHPRTRPVQITTLHCGDIITTDTVMGNDLDCPNTTGFALQVVGNGIKFDGNGHTITAPQAGAGLYVNGSSVTVFGLKVRSANYGIFAYDSPDVLISACNVSGNQIGIELYAEKTRFTGAQVFGNIATHNAVFGIHTGQLAPGALVSPLIFANDFSHSGLYAMAITAASFEYSGLNFNSMFESSNGLYLSQGNFNIHDLSLSSEMIPGAQIFADAALNVRIENTDVSSLTPSLSNQERTGIDFYEVAHFSISNVTARNNDMGIRLETQSGVDCSGQIIRSRFEKNDVAGVSIISYDGTRYGNIDIKGNCFKESSSELNIVLDPNTLLGSGSLIQ